MARKVSAREARANFSDLLGAVYYSNEQVIIERNGKPVAVLISPQQHKVLQQVIQEAW